jgi:hypothetical protein
MNTLPRELRRLHNAFQGRRIARWQRALDTYRILSSESPRLSELIPVFSGLAGVSRLICSYVGYAADPGGGGGGGGGGAEDAKNGGGRAPEETEFHCYLPMQLRSVPRIGQLLTCCGSTEWLRRVWRRQSVLDAPAARAGLFLSLVPHSTLLRGVRLHRSTRHESKTVLATRNVAEQGSRKVVVRFSDAQWSLVAYSSTDPQHGLDIGSILALMRAAAAQCGLELMGHDGSGIAECGVRVLRAHSLRERKKRKRSILQ